MMKHNILFITDSPSPYRVDFFNLLGEDQNLTVVFESRINKNRDNRWMKKKGEHFHEIFLDITKTRKGLKIDTSIIRIINMNFDFVIFGDYSSHTSLFAIEYMRLTGKPFYIEADGGFIKEDSRLKFLIKKRYISSAKGWLSSGKYTTDYLCHYGAKQEQCYLYPFTSLNEENISKNATMRNLGDLYRSKLGMYEKHILISVGRFTYKRGYGKGYDIILKLSEMNTQDFGFYIIGDNPTEEFIRQKERLCLNNLHFVGYKDSRELAGYYAAADIFILMTIEDVWGLVINEAMSFGLPIITTNKCVAGLELIRSKANGIIVDVGDTVGANRAIHEIVSQDNYRESYYNNNTEAIRKYTIENMVLQHNKLFDQVRGEKDGK